MEVEIVACLSAASQHQVVVEVPESWTRHTWPWTMWPVGVDTVELIVQRESYETILSGCYNCQESLYEKSKELLDFNKNLVLMVEECGKHD